MKTYNARDIVVREGLEGVRANSAMYLGALGSRGTFQVFKEHADNAIDEVKQRRGGSGSVLIRISGDSVIVADNGRGIPVDIHPKTKKSGVETVFTMLHAGAKTGPKNAYGKNTIGVHGVGASVSNALSEKCVVQTRRGSWHEITFSKGYVVAPLHKIKQPLIKMPQCGTVVNYVIDKSILPEALNVFDVTAYCDINRFFSPVSIRLEVVDARGNVRAKDYKPLDPSVLVRRIVKQQELDTLTDPFVIVTPDVRIVGVWTNSTSPFIASHVSGSPTTGGTHVVGFRDTLSDLFRQVMRRELSAHKFKIDPLSGLVAILDFKMDKPSFEGQAKTVLASSSARTVVRDAISKPLTTWLRKHKEELQDVVEHVVAVSKIASQIDNNKKLLREARKHGGTSQFPKNAAVALNVPAAKRELFITEGDSAGGTAKKAKMPYQEILPLRGKIPNVMKLDAKAKTNESLLNIIRMTGFDPSNPSKQLRVGKIMLLTDADVDGDHITVLLMTALHRMMPSVFDRGLVYVVEAPLFEALSGGKQVYGDSLAQLRSRGKSLTNIHRMKGWGSCEAPMLREVAFDPKTRRLARVRPISKGDSLKFELLMGSDTSFRRKLLGI